MKKIPNRLKQEPLIEAIWEVRFDSPGSGDILLDLYLAPCFWPLMNFSSVIFVFFVVNIKPGE